MENAALDNHVISVNIPTKSDFNDVAQESINDCVTIVKHNALNSALYCNCKYHLSLNQLLEHLQMKKDIC